MSLQRCLKIYSDQNDPHKNGFQQRLSSGFSSGVGSGASSDEQFTNNLMKLPKSGASQMGKLSLQKVGLSTV